MAEKKTNGTRRKYDASFKEDVLRMVATGRSVSDIAQGLGIGVHIIYRWIKMTKQSDGDDNPLLAPGSFAEMERLRAALHRTEQERDILKKALGIFSRGN